MSWIFILQNGASGSNDPPVQAVSNDGGSSGPPRVKNYKSLSLLQFYVLIVVLVL